METLVKRGFHGRDRLRDTGKPLIVPTHHDESRVTNRLNFSRFSSKRMRMAK